MFITCQNYNIYSGADSGFQVRGGGGGGGGAHLKKLRRAEGGAKIVGVFRVKNHDCTPKKIIFLTILGGGAHPARPPPPPPPESAPDTGY